jgi:hypothetical protein
MKIKELSKAVANVYKDIPESAYVAITNSLGDYTLKPTPLYQDTGRLARLCAVEGISVTQSKHGFVLCKHFEEEVFDVDEERYSDYISVIEATQISMLKALARKAEIDFEEVSQKVNIKAQSRYRDCASYPSGDYVINYTNFIQY